MRRLLLLCAVLAGIVGAVPARAQYSPQGGPTPADCVIGPITASAPQRWVFDNRVAECSRWSLIRYASPGNSAISIEVDEAPDGGGVPGTWQLWQNRFPDGMLCGETNPDTTADMGFVDVFKYAPWVSVNLTSITGGATNFILLGWRAAYDSTNRPPLFSCASSLSDGMNQVNAGFAPKGGVWVNEIALFNGASADRAVKCPTAVPITISAAGTAQIIAPSGGKLGRVCGLFLAVTTGGTLTITEGTGATCGTGTTNVSGAMTLPVGMAPLISSPTSVLQTNVLGDGLCLTSGTAVAAGWAQVEQH